MNSHSPSSSFRPWQLGRSGLQASLLAVVLATSAIHDVAAQHEDSAENVDSLAVESSRLRLVLRDDLKGIAHLIDKQTGRDYAADTNRPLGLYALDARHGRRRSGPA